SRRRHTRFSRDWSSDVCSSDRRKVMRRKIHMAMLGQRSYRILSRKMIRKVKSSLGCPDAWGELASILKANPNARYLDIGAHHGRSEERRARKATTAKTAREHQR